MLSGERSNKLGAFWREALQGAPPELRLASPAPADTGRGRMARRRLPEELSVAMEQLARNEGATLFTTLLAAYSVLLHFYSGAPKVVVGFPSANRNRTETEEMIGFFVNMLPVRIDVSASASFLELLRTVRTTVLAAFAHRELPFDKIVDAVKPPRIPGRPPLFQVVFQLDNLPIAPIELPGLTLEWVEQEDGDETTARYDLAMRAVRGQHGIDLFLNYRASMFDPAWIDQLFQDYQSILSLPDLPSQWELSEPGP
jgi:non-ribosomal peptide synthetase component F